MNFDHCLYWPREGRNLDTDLSMRIPPKVSTASSPEPEEAKLAGDCLRTPRVPTMIGYCGLGTGRAGLVIRPKSDSFRNGGSPRAAAKRRAIFHLQRSGCCWLTLCGWAVSRLVQ